MPSTTPSNLYAYTDPNVTGETLYAWDDPEAGTSNEIYYNDAPMPRVYTDTLNPTVDSNLYDEYGTILDVTEFSDDERLPTIVALNSSTSSSGIYFELYQGGAWYCHYNRGNSSEDIVLPPSQPATLYTDSTTLTTSMTLYDNTGTDTNYATGEIISESSFGLAKAKYQLFTLPMLGSFSVAYGNGVWVAVKQDNMTMHTSALRSTDGINWTSIVLPVEEHWWGITYGGGKFIITSVKNNNEGGEDFLYSSDGVTWTSTPAPVASGWYGILYGNNIFVAIGTNISTTSTDGITWTTPQTVYDSSSVIFREIAYGNGTWMVFSTSIYGNVMGAKYSTNNAASWIDGSGSGPGTVNNASMSSAYGNNTFVCINKANGQIVYWSTTGALNSSSYYINESLNLRPGTNLCTYNNMFFNISDNYFTWSTDAHTWSIENTNMTLPAIIDICSDNNGHFVAMPQSNTTGLYITLCANF